MKGGGREDYCDYPRREEASGMNINPTREEENLIRSSPTRGRSAKIQPRKRIRTGWPREEMKSNPLISIKEVGKKVFSQLASASKE